MKKSQRRTAKLDDDDIGSLFDQQALEPPAMIDDAILVAAQNALAEQSSSMDVEPASTQHRSSHWYHLAATAAVLVLAVTLVPALLRSPEYQSDSSPSISSQSIPVERPTPALASAPASAPELPADEVAVRDDIEQSRSLRQKLIETDSATSAGEATNPATTDYAASVKAASAKNTNGPDRTEATRKEAAHTEAAREEAARAEADSDAVPAGNAEAEFQRRAASRAAKENKLQTFSQRIEPALALKATPEPSIEEESADSRVTQSGMSAVDMVGSEQRPLAPRSYPLTAESNNEITHIEKEKRLLIHAQEAFRQSPGKWADEIVRLYEADDLEDAKREYALFKLMYPELADGARLPEELRKSEE